MRNPLKSKVNHTKSGGLKDNPRIFFSEHREIAIRKDPSMPRIGNEEICFEGIQETCINFIQCIPEKNLSFRLQTPKTPCQR